MNSHPELGIGYRFAKRLSPEASWVHMSHAGLFNRRQNPGIDNIGVRLNYRRRGDRHPWRPRDNGFPEPSGPASPRA